MAKPGEPLKTGQVKAIFEKLSEGESKYRIADELGIHVRTVIRWTQLGEEEAIKKAMKLREQITDYQIPRKEIENDPLAKVWLSTYSGRGGENRSTALLYFCNLVERKPKKLIEEAETEIRGGKLLRERGYFKHFHDFEQWLQAKNYAPHTIRALVSGVKAFYQYYQIFELPKRLQRKTNHVAGLEENTEAKLTKRDIKDMLGVCRYLRDKAIILSLSSSGIGGAEARNMTLRDFFKGYDTKNELCELSLTRVKTGYRFTSFFSPEATQTIREYLKIERGVTEEDFEKYLKLAKENKSGELKKPLFTELRREDGKRKGGKRATGNKLTDSAWIRIFQGIAQRLGSYKLNGSEQILYHKYHAHLLRKYFNTQMKEAGAPDMAIELMLSHRPQTKEAYYKTNKLKEIYMKYMPSVIIHPTETHVLESKEYTELNEKLEDYRGALAERNGKIEELEDKIVGMEAREEARAPYDDKMTELMKRLIANPELKELIKRELKETKGEKP